MRRASIAYSSRGGSDGRSASVCAGGGAAVVRGAGFHDGAGATGAVVTGGGAVARGTALATLGVRVERSSIGAGG
jgi:hypothetical protein